MLLDDFKTHTLIFQVQYKEAFVLWDNAGKIADGLKSIWKDLAVQEGTPNQQVLVGRGCQVNSGLLTSSITLRGDSLLQDTNVKNISDAFDIWKKNLNLEQLTRISARVIYSKNFSSESEAKDYVFKLGLVKWPSEKVFDQPIESPRNVPEVVLRFEDEKSFVFVRVRTDHRKVDMRVDPDIMEEIIDKELFRVLIDFDKGNLGTIPVNKIKIVEWFSGYTHIMRRDIDKVLRIGNE